VDAVDAAVAAGVRFGLRGVKPVLLRSTNNWVVWLAPSAVVVKVGPVNQLAIERLVAVALWRDGAPVVAPAPGLPVDLHEEAGHAMSFWTYQPQRDEAVPDAVVASHLAQLHGHLSRLPIGLRSGLPRFTNEIERALSILDDARSATSLSEADRSLLAVAGRELLAILGSSRHDAVLHGSPHTYNALRAGDEVMFIDFEAVCVGPIEWDLAYQSAAVAWSYPGDVDRLLLDQCRTATSVKTAAFCWADADRGDLRRHAEFHTALVRDGRP
jgi:hypothetical protein